MAENDVGTSTEEESLKNIFDQSMKLFEEVENTKEPTNSDSVQLSIRTAISKLEKATNLVSLSGMFSRNESLDELPTDSLQYLLLPALLGTLSLKVCSQPRKEVINVADIYFRDFLQRCKDYGVTNVEVPQPPTDKEPSTSSRPRTEVEKIASMVQTRDEKIKRFKEQKELKEKLQLLTHAVSSPIVDEETKRDYFTTLLTSYVNQALDELSSIEQEKPILEYMEKHAGEPKHKEVRKPLRPVIITKDAVQKAVFGAGYPALPSLTIEEFYDKRVREGTFPGACNIPRTTIQSTEEEEDETRAAQKEQLIETDDPEELARMRNMDEYKDDHRRGEGNRHNRS